MFFVALKNLMLPKDSKSAPTSSSFTISNLRWKDCTREANTGQQVYCKKLSALVLNQMYKPMQLKDSAVALSFCSCFTFFLLASSSSFLS